MRVVHALFFCAIVPFLQWIGTSSVHMQHAHAFSASSALISSSSRRRPLRLRRCLRLSSSSESSFLASSMEMSSAALDGCFA